MFRGKPMIITTTDSIEGAAIESYKGVVTVQVVYGTNALKDLFAKLRDVIGGRTGSYEDLFRDGQIKALEELKKKAKGLGANAVVGVEIDTGSITIDVSGTLVLITAAGTAVKISSK